jgi:hypothetical protein
MTWDVFLRLSTFALIAVVAFLWPRDLRRYWHEFDGRARRITLGVIPVFVSNALGLLNAVYLGRSATWVSYLLIASYALLVFVLIWNPRSERR